MEKQLEELLTCPVCLDRYKRPKILPCQHTFCIAPCLQKLVVDKSIRCPQCRCTHKLPRQGLSGLPNNLTISSLLELPSKQVQVIVCQECLKESCNPKKCCHCEKKLCESCQNVHCQQLMQSLSRSINQLKRILPKVSEMITDLEEKQSKSAISANAVKAEVDQVIERCASKLESRRQSLHEQIDSFIAAESQQLRQEQENIEMEMAYVHSHCDNAEMKCKLFLESKKPEDRTISASEISQLTMQCQEHMRNLKLISTNVEDKIAHNVKFHNEGEKSLLTSVGGFGEVTVNIPSRLSFTLGSDPEINNAEIHRALQAPQPRRRPDFVESYVPSFFSLSPMGGSRATSTSPSTDSFSAQGSLGSNSPHPLSDLPIFGMSLQPPNHPRPRRNPNRRSYNGPSSRYVREPSESSRSVDSSNVTSYTSVRGTLWLYRSKGPVKRWFGTKGSDVGCLSWPRGLASSSQDHVVVADSSNHRVHVFESNGDPIKTFGGYGTDESQFDCVSGIHVTAQGWIITSDRYNHRIQIFDSLGRFIRMFGKEGTGEGELSYPWGVTTDNMGFVYVCDKDNHRIQVFTLDGQFIRKFGRIGSCDSQFDSPHYIAVTTDNKVIVSDSGNHRIQVFDKYGRFLLKFGREGSAEGLLKYPRGVAVDRHGNVVVGDSGNNRVQVYSSDGTYICGFGSWGPAPGQMKGIEGISLLSNCDIVVSDRENHRVQVF